ncbi:Glycerophosphocholine phosphodiesterase gpcpd1 [Tritrichomonas musculus]|uniref:Glycerophosphocholine phosphodiesterase gpcpd1 n=1 Tax=Tritrichomonas musculus TaxID=1915356 RepID=A0ABR2IQ44_9EUKA
MVKKIRSFIELHKKNGVEGFVGDSNHISQATYLIKEINDNNFICCTYGQQNDVHEGIEKQIQLGVRGICTNKVPLSKKIIDDKKRMKNNFNLKLDFKSTN